MSLLYRRPDPGEAADLDMLVAMRMAQLQEETGQSDPGLAPALHDFYRRHFLAGDFVSWVAEEEGRTVATSGMSFVEKPPYHGNPTGRIGLLSSMYTRPEYRRRGIAKTLLGRVVQEARERGCGVVQLTSSDAGVPLYTDFGFTRHPNFMQYKPFD